MFITPVSQILSQYGEVSELKIRIAIYKLTINGFLE